MAIRLLRFGVARAKLRPIQLLVVALAAVLMVVVAMRLEKTDHRSFIQQARTDVTVELFDLREEIEDEVFGLVLSAQRVAITLRTTPAIDQALFSEVASEVLSENPYIRNVAASRNKEVQFSYPLDENRDVIGFDYRTDPIQERQIDNATTLGGTVIYGPVDLIQGGEGLILREPVFLASGGHWGTVSLVLDYDSFTQRVGLMDALDSLDVLITRGDTQGSADTVVYGSELVLGRNPVVLNFDFGSQGWEIAGTPSGGWPSVEPGVWVDRLVDGLVVATVLAVLTYILYLSEARRLARAQLIDAVHALDDGFALFDKDERLVLSNTRYKAIYDPERTFIQSGMKFEDIIRGGIRAGRHPDAEGREEEWLQERLRVFREGRSVSEHVLAGGAIMQVTDRATGSGGTVGLRVDVTELNRAREAAEEANRAKTRFMNILSHELRTPMTVILGHVSLAKNIEKSSASRELFEAIARTPGKDEGLRDSADALLLHVSTVMSKLERSGTHLLNLINEMLDFAKIESGTLAVEVETCSTANIIDPVKDEMRVPTEQRGLNLIVEHEEFDVSADPGRTRQILYNLLGNALKFTTVGSITLRVRADRERVYFSVEDTGPGIAQEHAERIFEAFEQADSSAARAANGTGLGLAISRQLAAAQGGTLTLKSKVGEGSTFTLALHRASGSMLSDRSLAA